MKTKNFDDYLKKRLNKHEIKELELQAKLEFEALQHLQHDVSLAFSEYMNKEKIGFNEIVRRLHISPTQVTKIKKGQANLTLATLAHVAALLKKRPRIIFENQ